MTSTNAQTSATRPSADIQSQLNAGAAALHHPEWCIGQEGRSADLWDCFAMDAHRGHDVEAFHPKGDSTVFRVATFQALGGYETDPEYWGPPTVHLSAIDHDLTGGTVRCWLDPEEAEALGRFLIDAAARTRSDIETERINGARRPHAAA